MIAHAFEGKYADAEAERDPSYARARALYFQLIKRFEMMGYRNPRRSAQALADWTYWR